MAELEAATQARDNARRMYDQLRKERLDKFMDGFSRIGLKLKEMYQVSRCSMLSPSHCCVCADPPLPHLLAVVCR